MVTSIIQIYNRKFEHMPNVVIIFLYTYSLAKNSKVSISIEINLKLRLHTNFNKVHIWNYSIKTGQNAYFFGAMDSFKKANSLKRDVYPCN